LDAGHLAGEIPATNTWLSVALALKSSSQCSGPAGIFLWNEKTKTKNKTNQLTNHPKELSDDHMINQFYLW
tara:strand:+ start:174 stop:386 length:213 start_codon:yes stop_codon:yes gene_type:complete